MTLQSICLPSGERLSDTIQEVTPVSGTSSIIIRWNTSPYPFFKVVLILCHAQLRACFVSHSTFDSLQRSVPISLFWEASRIIAFTLTVWILTKQQYARQPQGKQRCFSIWKSSKQSTSQLCIALFTFHPCKSPLNLTFIVFPSLMPLLILNASDFCYTTYTFFGGLK